MSTESIAARADALHRQAIVIDGHSDLLMPIADGLVRLGRQVTLPDPARYTPPFEMAGDPASQPIEASWPQGSHFGCIGHYSLPQFLAGGLTAQVCALFVRDEELDHALRRCLDMVWWMRREAEENEAFELATTAADIRRCKAQGQVGGIMALEGLEPVGSDVRFLDLFYALGVRIAGMAHNRRSLWVDGTMNNVTPGGLTSAGRAAIRRMNELGIVVDVAHMNPACFWETLELSDAPVILSHGSAKRFFPRRPEDSPLHAVRDVTRGPERLEALARKGGVFGVFFLFRQATIDTVVAEIEYLWDVMGPDHVGLGTDFYGLTELGVFDLDLGRIGVSICFDINWPDEWRQTRQRGVELVCWLSAFDGGVPLQAYAWTHKYYIVSSVLGMSARFINITGHILGATSKWSRLAIQDINFDRMLCHIGTHWDQLPAIQARYGDAVRIQGYTDEDIYTIEPTDDRVTLQQLVRENDLETYDAYIARCTQAQNAARPSS